MNGWMDARMRLNECMNGWTMVSNILAISSRRIASKLRELAARMQRCLQTCINRPGGANLLAAATSNWMSRRGFASKGVSLWHEAFNFLMLTVTVTVGSGNCVYKYVTNYISLPSENTSNHIKRQMHVAGWRKRYNCAKQPCPEAYANVCFEAWVYVCVCFFL